MPYAKIADFIPAGVVHCPAQVIDGPFFWTMDEDILGGHRLLLLDKVTHVLIRAWPTTELPAGLNVFGPYLIGVTNNDPAPGQGSIVFWFKANPGVVVRKISPAGLVTPTGLFVAKDLIFVSDLFDNKVKVYTWTGTLVKEIAGYPGNVAVSAPEDMKFNGRLIQLCDRDNEAVYEQELSGEMVGAWVPDGLALRDIARNGRSQNYYVHTDANNNVDIIASPVRPKGEITLHDLVTQVVDTIMEGELPSNVGAPNVWANITAEPDYFVASGDGGIKASWAGDSGDKRMGIETGILHGCIGARIEWRAGYAGLVFRHDGVATPNETGIFAWYDGANLNIARLLNGVFGGAAGAAFTWNVGDIHYMEVGANEDRFYLAVDGIERLRGTYAGYTGTKAGVFLRANETSIIRNILARKF